MLAALEQPLKTAGGTMAAAPLVLLDVTSSEGAVGHAYLCAYRPEVLASLTTLLHDLSALLVGKPVTPRAAISTLRRELLLLGTPGLADMALAGLDIALWDLHARSLELPLVRALGGEPTPVKAYASYGMDGESRAAADAATAAVAGFRAIKVKVGYGTVEEDLAVIQAVRANSAPGTDIMIDYNQSLTASEALRRCHALDGENLAWIEEPVRYDDLEGHARIRESTFTPIQLGENSWGPRGVRAMLTQHASDLVMLDLMKVGGVSGWLAAAALCETANVPVSDHFYQEPSVHLMSLSSDSHYLEFYGLANAVLSQPLRAVDGYVTPGNQPGNGIEFDDDAVDRFIIIERALSAT